MPVTMIECDGNDEEAVEIDKDSLIFVENVVDSKPQRWFFLVDNPLS
jgi:hypothetical protein